MSDDKLEYMPKKKASNARQVRKNKIKFTTTQIHLVFFNVLISGQLFHKFVFDRITNIILIMLLITEIRKITAIA